MKLRFAFALTAVALLGSGCAAVQPWEKGHLARPEMSFDPDPLESRFAQHIYYSKENASGGYGVGGGGCGCN
jgi:opacity protein-like surface antigen